LGFHKIEESSSFNRNISQEISFSQPTINGKFIYQEIIQYHQLFKKKMHSNE
jgi:hypothetical protein